jgi:hypothetical protein
MLLIIFVITLGLHYDYMIRVCRLVTYLGTSYLGTYEGGILHII